MFSRCAHISSVITAALPTEIPVPLLAHMAPQRYRRGQPPAQLIMEPSEMHRLHSTGTPRDYQRHQQDGIQQPRWPPHRAGNALAASKAKIQWPHMPHYRKNRGHAAALKARQVPPQQNRQRRLCRVPGKVKASL